MPDHVLVVGIPAHGHMRPVLAVVEELVGRGLRVSVLATAEFAAAVEGVGAQAVVCRTQMADWLGAGRVGNADPDADSLAWSRVLFFIEASHLVDKALEHFAADIPDLVLYDMSVAPAGRALGHLWDRPVVQSTPSFGSNARYSQVDVVLAAAGVGPGHPAGAELRKLASEFIERHGLAHSAESLVDWAADDAIVYVPKEFQVAADGFDDRTAFVGPCLGSGDLKSEWTPDGERPLVVVSMGTTVNGGTEFFREVADAFADEPWTVVMTLGASADDLGPLPPNVSAHAWIPQLAVLEHADAFVTSGGLGSVTMALRQGVPMVVVPKIPECKVVARRVAALGLGTVVASSEASGPRLRAAVADLLADTATGERVAAMRERTREAGGARAAAALVESRLAVPAG